MNLQERIDLLSRLGEYILSGDIDWKLAKEKAATENSWFIPEFVDLASKNIAEQFLKKDILEKWTASYKLQTINDKPKIVGIVMAGNIPLVGFHDLLCVFITGHRAMVKLSSRDQVLMKHLVDKMTEWNKEVSSLISFEERLKGCDVYIATGSNNTAAHFEYYFRKYPHIIRRNRTSLAVLSGNETNEELEKLADDVYLYFGLGCRNVTKIYVPAGYDFIPLLSAFKKYNWMADHNKYKNNYDYNLSLHILNKKYYMSNESLLLLEETSFFSRISQLNYEFYTNINVLKAALNESKEIQGIIGHDFLPFGSGQQPSVSNYADGIDTMSFLAQLK